MKLSKAFRAGMRFVDRIDKPNPEYEKYTKKYAENTVAEAWRDTGDAMYEAMGIKRGHENKNRTRKEDKQ